MRFPTVCIRTRFRRPECGTRRTAPRPLPSLMIFCDWFGYAGRMRVPRSFGAGAGWIRPRRPSDDTLRVEEVRHFWHMVFRHRARTEILLLPVRDGCCLEEDRFRRPVRSRMRRCVRSAAPRRIAVRSRRPRIGALRRSPAGVCRFFHSVFRHNISTQQK